MKTKNRKLTLLIAGLIIGVIGGLLVVWGLSLIHI